MKKKKKNLLGAWNTCSISRDNLSYCLYPNQIDNALSNPEASSQFDPYWTQMLSSLNAQHELGDPSIEDHECSFKMLNLRKILKIYLVLIDKLQIIYTWCFLKWAKKVTTHSLTKRHLKEEKDKDILNYHKAT